MQMLLKTRQRFTLRAASLLAKGRGLFITHCLTMRVFSVVVHLQLQQQLSAMQSPCYCWWGRRQDHVEPTLVL